jgi:hypothetical protein
LIHRKADLQVYNSTGNEANNKHKSWQWLFQLSFDFEMFYTLLPRIHCRNSAVSRLAMPKVGGFD